MHFLPAFFSLFGYKTGVGTLENLWILEYLMNVFGVFLPFIVNFDFLLVFHASYGFEIDGACNSEIVVSSDFE